MRTPVKNYSQSGQTMIETLVAIFMLVMGVTAALGLAIYALNSSTNISKQIVATGLAREALEAVKNMRDTNWLLQTSIDRDCYNYSDNTSTGLCYKRWLGTSPGSPAPFFCLDPTTNNGNCNGGAAGATNNYFLSFDSASGSYWIFPSGGTTKFGLKFDPNNLSGMGFYNSEDSNGINCSNASANISDFCRKVTITKIGNSPAVAPYNQDEGPMIKVQSFVWWVGKNCPRVADFPQASPACRLEMDTYLTNWKNYIP